MPPLMTVTETDVPFLRSFRLCIYSAWCAASITALIPASGALPEWAARPTVRTT